MGARGILDMGGQPPMKPATNGASRMPARSQAPRAKLAAPAANRMPPRPGMGMLFVCNFFSMRNFDIDSIMNLI